MSDSGTTDNCFMRLQSRGKKDNDCKCGGGNSDMFGYSKIIVELYYKNDAVWFSSDRK